MRRMEGYTTTKNICFLEYKGKTSQAKTRAPEEKDVNLGVEV